MSSLPLSQTPTLEASAGLSNNIIGPGVVAANGTYAGILMHGNSSHAAANGITFKRDDSTWGFTQPYGEGQPFAVFSPSTQAATDQTGDYNVTTPGENPLLLRIDPYGGVGIAGTGLHIAPGLRDTYGGGAPIGLWVQLGQGGADTPGIIVSMPASGGGYVQPGIIVEDNTASNHILTVDSTGLAVYSATNVHAVDIYAGATGSSNKRSMFRSIGAGVVPINVQLASAQTADAVDIFASDGVTKLCWIDSSGNVHLPADPTSALMAATKQYVDAAAAGNITTPPAQCAAVVNQVLTGQPTIDGVALTNNNVVLLVGQTTQSQNGPWQLPASGSGAWVRPIGWATGSSVFGKALKVLGGTIYKGTEWQMLQTSSVVVDTGAQTWQMQGAAFFQGILTDGGSLQQWTVSTPAAVQTVWAYNGVTYMRNAPGTDSSFIRANWTEIGVDPSVAAGGELASMIFTSSVTLSATTTYQDITGATVAPVIPSSGRGIYLDIWLAVNCSVATTAEIQLYDVTVGAPAVDPTGAAVGVCASVWNTANKGQQVTQRWRLAPAAGSHLYKLQVKTLAAATFYVLGRDLISESGIYVTAR